MNDMTHELMSLEPLVRDWQQASLLMRTLYDDLTMRVRMHLELPIQDPETDSQAVVTVDLPADDRELMPALRKRASLRLQQCTLALRNGLDRLDSLYAGDGLRTVPLPVAAGVVWPVDEVRPTFVEKVQGECRTQPLPQNLSQPE